MVSLLLLEKETVLVSIESKAMVGNRLSIFLVYISKLFKLVKKKKIAVKFQNRKGAKRDPEA